MPKLILIGNCMGAGGVFDHLFKRKIQLPSQFSPKFKAAFDNIIEKGDIILYGGGEDISPSLYKEKLSKQTWARPTPSERDLAEKYAFEVAQKEGLKSYGICRGAQLLCALSGGSVVQHVNGHGNSHFITTTDGNQYLTSSAHHQMMWPFKMPKEKYEILASVKNNISNVYVFNDSFILRVIEEKEPEVIFFKDTNSIAIQGHPEFMQLTSPFVGYCQDLMVKLMHS